MTKKNRTIAIVDYGVGNLYSIKKALDNFNNNVFITEDPEKIYSADAVILPGVGSFGAGMEGLKVRSLIEPVKKFSLTGKPMLGICLGAQLLLDKGYEFGEFSGLGIIPGKVVKFPELKKERIPHIGWNEICANQLKVESGKLKVGEWKGTILDSIKENSDVYFVHSYILQPDKQSNVLAIANYGGYEFCSAIRKGNIYGCQFHPEKSGQIGLQIIKNFVSIVRSSQNPIEMVSKPFS